MEDAVVLPGAGVVMQSSVQISDDFFRTVDRQLSQFEIIGRSKVLDAGIRKGLNLVKSRVRDILPKPGYPGDKPGLKPLRDTVSVRIRRYQNDRYVVGMVGYEWGAGSHGHVVEHGHRIASGGTLIDPNRTTPRGRGSGRGLGRVIGFVPGRYYLQRAVQSLGNQIEGVIVDAIDAAIVEARS